MGGIEREKRKENIEEEKGEKQKNYIYYKKKKNRLLCQLWAFNIREGETFHSIKVNLDRKSVV